jgi:hypothetical protein
MALPVLDVLGEGAGCSAEREHDGGGQGEGLHDLSPVEHRSFGPSDPTHLDPAQTPGSGWRGIRSLAPSGPAPFAPGETG